MHRCYPGLFFYLGLVFLLYDCSVAWHGRENEAEFFPYYHKNEGLIIVDGRVLCSNVYSISKYLMTPNSSILWFTASDSWNIFPSYDANNFRIFAREKIQKIRDRVLELFRLWSKHHYICLKPLSLTKKERDILRCTIQGHKVSYISKMLGLDLKHVYYVRKNVVEKFGLGSARELVNVYCNIIRVFLIK
ncbi:hypothetical protein BFG07_00875 [Kosakonia cowanii]|uniref:helix-turn-helix domain-containing protein n=1 Tax=Kosakonia cowanii TaxID=208223 RepID=UPI000B97C349|nr:helix-turn-helix transcriptional regulator [Kosakonia cowanii]AST67376.1 hypothetical protein BFG07_00875 [Kosakonia cowanii]